MLMLMPDEGGWKTESLTYFLNICPIARTLEQTFLGHKTSSSRIVVAQHFWVWLTLLLIMADITRSSYNLARDVEMANRGEPYLSVGSMFMIDICFLVTSYTSNNHFTQGENEGYQADGDENARNIPTHVREGDKIDEDFDPWALPELQDFGPKWSGRLRAIVYVATLSVLLFQIQGTECKAFVRRNLTNLLCFIATILGPKYWIAARLKR